MNSFFQNKIAYFKGGIITISMVVVLNGLGLIFRDAAYLYINIYIFIFSWLLISFLISKIPLYKVLCLVLVFIATIALDNYLLIPDNPITISLIILFWIGVVSFVLPQFFQKYRIPIFFAFGLATLLFFIFRMMPNYLEDHRDLFKVMLIPIPIFAALWVYEQWRWLKTIQADKANTELALLKSQINPHFFFNTLNNLYGLVVEKSESAPEVILKLSDMMRYTIYEGKEDLVLLKDEINYLENYIELHKIRYRRKVDILFSHEVEEGLKIAPLLFIILLENSFKHGVDKMQGQAFIHLRMESQGKHITFTIENSFDPSTSNSSNGIGLENLKKRLLHSYPNRHELKTVINESSYKVQLNLELI